MNSLADLRVALRSLPRVSLAHLPTPLERLEALSDRLESIELLVKRDDQTGLAMGGNKTRKLEFVMADVMAHGADSIVTWGGVQSNWCRQVAAAAVRLRIKPVLVLFNSAASQPGYDGNLLLDRLFNAEIRIVDATGIGSMMEYASVRHVIDPIVEEVREAGLAPYVAPIGGSLVEASMSEAWGALGYVEAFVELMQQVGAENAKLDAIVLASGSGGTQAGLLAAARVASPSTKIVGISVYERADKLRSYVRSIMQRTFSRLGVAPAWSDEDIIVLDQYLGEGYGVLNEDVAQAIDFVAQEEGLLLDPVYTGKAMAAMLDLVAQGYFAEGGTLLFLHTGGTPALFPYREQLLRLLG